jgi:hypothetical protein
MGEAQMAGGIRMNYYCYKCDSDSPCVLQVEDMDLDPEFCPFSHTTDPDWITEEQNKSVASWLQVMSKSNLPTAVVLEVLAELEQAKKKHPEFPAGIVRQVSIMAEEAGEAIREANRIEDDGIGDLAALRTELIQTAAMCLRVIENMR